MILKMRKFSLNHNYNHKKHKWLPKRKLRDHTPILRKRI